MFVRFNDSENKHIEQIVLRILNERSKDSNDLLVDLAKRIAHLEAITNAHVLD